MKNHQISCPAQSELDRGWREYSTKNCLFFDSRMKLYAVTKYHGEYYRQWCPPNFENDNLLYFRFFAKSIGAWPGEQLFVHLVVNKKTGKVVYFSEDKEKPTKLYLLKKEQSFVIDTGKNYKAYLFDGKKYNVFVADNLPKGWQRYVKGCQLVFECAGSRIKLGYGNPEHRIMLDKAKKARNEIP